MEGRIAYNINDDCWRVQIDTGPGRFVEFCVHLNDEDREMWMTVAKGMPIHRALAAGAETLKDAYLAGAFR